MSDKDLVELKEDVKEILNILNGNGKLGMCAKVNVMWSVGMFVISVIGVQSVVLVRVLMSQ